MYWGLIFVCYVLFGSFYLRMFICFLLPMLVNFASAFHLKVADPMPNHFLTSEEKLNGSLVHSLSSIIHQVAEF